MKTKENDEITIPKEKNDNRQGGEGSSGIVDPATLRHTTSPEGNTEWNTWEMVRNGLVITGLRMPLNMKTLDSRTISRISGEGFGYSSECQKGKPPSLNTSHLYSSPIGENKRKRERRQKLESSSTPSRDKHWWGKKGHNQLLLG